MTDLVAHIEQVRRETVDRGATKVVILARSYATTVEDVWQACTDPARLARWFEPVAGDLRLGGRYRLEGSGTTGTVEHCDPPGHLRVTWEWEGSVSHLEVTVAERDGVAELRLEHVMAHDEHWDSYGPGATGVGWDLSLLALALHLAGDARAEPAEFERFTTTPEGTGLVRRAGSAWADAHVVSGAAAEAAGEAAERTVAFYSGSTQPG